MSTVSWFTFEDRDAIARDAAARFVEAAASAIATRGRADIVVTGGSLGIQMLAALHHFPAELAALDPRNVHVWWGDERFVGYDDADRNSAQAIAAWGDLLTGAHLHPMPAPDDAPDPHAAARAYAGQVADVHFDIVFLGLGGDGHVASLFPGHETVLNRTDVAVGETDSPKPPPQRVSLTQPRLVATDRLVLLFAAGDKQAAADAILAGARAHDSGAPGGQTVDLAAFTDEDYMATPARSVLIDGAVVLTDRPA